MAKRKVVLRDQNYFKPARFRDHLTISELSVEVNKDASWLKALEAAGRIPKAVRVKRGRLYVRLWSPAQVKEIKAILATHRIGRPRKNG